MNINKVFFNLLIICNVQGIRGAEMAPQSPASSVHHGTENLQLDGQYAISDRQEQFDTPSPAMLQTFKEELEESLKQFITQEIGHQNFTVSVPEPNVSKFICHRNKIVPRSPGILSREGFTETVVTIAIQTTIRTLLEIPLSYIANEFSTKIPNMFKSKEQKEFEAQYAAKEALESHINSEADQITKLGKVLESLQKVLIENKSSGSWFSSTPEKSQVQEITQKEIERIQTLLLIRSQRITRLLGQNS